MTLVRLVALIMGLSLWSAASGGEPEPTSWDRVFIVPPGTMVEVIFGSLKRVQGDLVSISPEEITVQGEGPRAVIAKTDVVRVSLVKSGRKQRALLGLALDAGAGAAVLALGAHAGDIDIRRDLIAGAGAVAGGASARPWERPRVGR